MPIQQSQSQTASYTALGNKDDFSPIITNIDPDLTYFLSNFSEGPSATQLKVNWMTEGLRPPQRNAHVEMANYETVPVLGIEQRDNTCQHFINSGKVSDAQRKSKKWYNQDDELERQMENAFSGHSRDIEYALVYNKASRLGNDTVAPLMGGIPYYMAVEKITVTFDVANQLVMTTVDHGFKTGEFVYFKLDGGTTLPTGISANVMYYIRVDATNPNQAFKIYDDIESAVEDTTPVNFTTAGTGVIAAIKNNVVDLGNTTDYTDENINDLMQMVYYRGGNPTLMMMSGKKKRRFSNIVAANATKLRDQHDKKAVNVTSQYETDFGTITAKTHRMYPDNRIDVMDMNYWESRWFDRTHEVPGLAKKGSYSEFVIESWLTLQGTQPLASGTILNIKR